jgi:RNA polymerase sigma-70 factor (ECF subfamily)
VKRLTDEQLMKRLQQGQTDALDELYKRYAKKLYVFCCHTTRSQNPQESEDLVQDVFIRVIKAAHTFDPQKASFRTWMFRIARNHCIDVVRRKEKIRFMPIGEKAEQNDHQEELVSEDTIVDPNQDVENSMIENSVVGAIRDCINELESQEERQALLLYYLGGKVYREIGEMLGKSTSMARNWIKSAQEKVKRCLERQGIHSAS